MLHWQNWTLCTRKDEDACRGKKMLFTTSILTTSYFDSIQDILRFSNDSYNNALFNIVLVQSNNQAWHGNAKLKTKLSVMTSFFELLTWKVFKLYKKYELITRGNLII